MKGINLLKELMESKMGNFEKSLEKFNNFNEYTTIQIKKLSEIKHIPEYYHSFKLKIIFLKRNANC